jgi:hypothetical protein
MHFQVHVVFLARSHRSARQLRRPAMSFRLAPPRWTIYTTGYIGNTTASTLTVDGNSDLLSSCGYNTYGGAAAGVVTFSGTGSTWDDAGDLIDGC